MSTQILFEPHGYFSPPNLPKYQNLDLGSLKRSIPSSFVMFLKPATAILLFTLGATGSLGVRPQVDFDTVINALQKQGEWINIEAGGYAFLPNETKEKSWAPYREGRWMYTDYGWTWSGTLASSWATDHYGYWAKQNGHWTWAPGEHWLPASVEWLMSGKYIGWRPCHLDRFSNMTEPESRRYRDPSEWNFIAQEKLNQPLTADDYAPEDLAGKLLRNALPLDHIFVSYREIPRPGPPPTAEDGGHTDVDPPLVIGVPSPGYTPKDKDLKKYFYLFRPHFNQDATGISKRVELHLKPSAKRDKLSESLLGKDKKKSESELKEEKKLKEKEENREERRHKFWDSMYQ